MAATRSEIPQGLHQTPLMAANCSEIPQDLPETPLMASNWSEIPQDLLERIQSKVTLLPDHLLFTSVCSSWRSTGVQNRHHISPKIPGLLFPGKARDSDTRRFIELTQNRHYHNLKDPANLPVPHNLHCCGSSFGWLALVDGKFDMHLFNPFSGMKLNLPSSTTLPKPPDDYRRFCKYYVRKAVLSSEPNDLGSTQSQTHTDQKVFVLVMFGHGKMAFCRLGDERWIPIKSKGERRDFVDAIYFKEKFYAVYNPGGLVTIDVSDSGRDTIEVMAEDFVLRPRGEYFWKTRYLVECQGELFVLRRNVSYGPDDVREEKESDDNYGHGDFLDYWVNNNVDEIRLSMGDVVADHILQRFGHLENRNNEVEGSDDKKVGDKSDEPCESDEESDGSVDNGCDCDDKRVNKVPRWYKTVGFKIFQLGNCSNPECTCKAWKKVENIGNNAFFVGINSSFSVSSLDFMVCRSNSIYFTDSSPAFEDIAKPVHHDIGVYNLERKVVDEVYPVDSKPTRPPAVWLTPVPQFKEASFCFLP